MHYIVWSSPDHLRNKTVSLGLVLCKNFLKTALDFRQAHWHPWVKTLTKQQWEHKTKPNQTKKTNKSQPHTNLKQCCVPKQDQSMLQLCMSEIIHEQNNNKFRQETTENTQHRNLSESYQGSLSPLQRHQKDWNQNNEISPHDLSTVPMWRDFV